jgi:hypothetical protein
VRWREVDGFESLTDLTDLYARVGHGWHNEVVEWRPPAEGVGTLIPLALLHYFQLPGSIEVEPGFRIPNWWLVVDDVLLELNPTAPDQ